MAAALTIVPVCAETFACSFEDFSNTLVSIVAYLEEIGYTVISFDGPPLTLSPTAPPTTSLPSLSPTSSPSLSPTDECADNIKAKFYVDEEIGDANCEWLVLNLDQYKYLCLKDNIHVTHANKYCA